VAAPNIRGRAETTYCAYLDGQFISYSEENLTQAHFHMTTHFCEDESLLAVEVFQRS
jgi:hypothetical protein